VILFLIVLESIMRKGVSMNKVILMGRLTKDPELRYLTNGTAKCGFTLAVERRFSKPGEQKQSDFFNIVAWKNQAEFCGKHFAKGQKVVVIGSLQNRSWDGPDGKKQYLTEVIVDECYFAESKKTDRPLSQSTDSSYIPSAGDDQDGDLPF
jgi:single-strand DNA-binding protein